MLLESLGSVATSAITLLFELQSGFENFVFAIVGQYISGTDIMYDPLDTLKRILAELIMSAAINIADAAMLYRFWPFPGRHSP